MAYQMALDGVTKHGLDTAVRNIMAGALGHGFMPSPPELRIQIDEVMRPLKEARARDQNERRILEDMAKDRKRRGMTPEQRERANQKWLEARAKMRAESQVDDARFNNYDLSREGCMARLQSAAEANGNDFNIDKIKNATSGPFKQIGRARG